MIEATVHDARPCALGEGPLWHPGRKQLFWFDIIGHRMLSLDDEEPLEWTFDEAVSAAGWVDLHQLFVASETQLFTFDTASGARETVAGLESDRPETRSNDGRADPMGGFWIGTMGKKFESGAGSIYRYYRGELRRIAAGLTVPNAICFSPDATAAFYTDTPTRQILRVALDGEGWPAAEPEVFIDLTGERPLPDGAVVDSEGAMWNAQWNMGRVARYLPDGTFDRAVAVAGRRASCPAFGGADLSTLFVTTARLGLDDPDAAQGVLYSAPAGVRGLPEPRVIL
jgi:sugar lactone lactonase YvrE